MPLPIGYLISTVVVIPIVIYGMRALERLQFWTTPLWLALALLPLLWIIVSDPEAVQRLRRRSRRLRRLGQLRGDRRECRRLLRADPAAGRADRRNPRHAAAHAAEPRARGGRRSCSRARAGCSSAASSR